MINNAPFNGHTDPLFRSSTILKLEDLLECQSVIFMTDYMHDTQPLSFKNMFTISSTISRISQMPVQLGNQIC